MLEDFCRKVGTRGDFDSRITELLKISIDVSMVNSMKLEKNLSSRDMDLEPLGRDSKTLGDRELATAK